LKAKQEGNEFEKNTAYLIIPSSENYFDNIEVSMKYIDSCISNAKTEKHNSLFIRALSQKG